MDALEALILLGAGVAAGAASSMAGGASLVSFPVLLALGLPPLTANVTNTTGLVPTAVGAALASRLELAGQRAFLARLVLPAVLGSLAGAAALLATPEAAFEDAVPALIGGSALLLLAQPWIAARAGRRLSARDRSGSWLSSFAACVYVGYFGAAAAVLWLGLAGLFSTASLHQLNALKNVVMGVANAVAAIAFAVVAPVEWSAVAPLALGALAGGALGVRAARRVPARALRAGVGVAGLAVAAWLALSGG
ncbi:MAG: sulfite exporter TauE/SafE family protein [Actinomycetota bacterium]|nr:sulfite exporter TauE/SafE family protein [Actinomycetota bacterium]